MSFGENRASDTYKRKKIIALLEKAQGISEDKDTCVFLSHINMDKEMVREIGNYITKAGIDIYLDENDTDLQYASSQGNDEKITKCIHNGIKESTNILCLLSPDTVKSWWVPYEIGYGEKAAKEISSLKLKELSSNNIPSYLKMKKIINGINELNDYLQSISKISVKKFDKFSDNLYKASKERTILQESANWHPLKNYLDQ